MADNIKEYDNRVYWIWLTMIFGIGSDDFWKNCRGYRTVKDFASDVMNGIVQLRTNGQKSRLDSISLDEANRVLERCIENGVEVTSFRSSKYPARLKKTSSPPPILYYKGDINLLSEMPSVAVIGTRNPCEYSIEITDSICTGLAKSGIMTISGFEDGVDLRANSATIEGGGKTVGVCGKGILDARTFSDEGEKISGSGVLIAEFTDTDDFGRVLYDHRNRIMCGLADVLLFVECSDISHGLNNVKHAERLGLPVFAVPPADINDRHFFGQRNLLRNGAFSAFDADDIIRFMSKMESPDGDGMVKYSNIKVEKSDKTTNRKKKERVNLKNNSKISSEGLHKSQNSATIDISDLSGMQKNIAELLKKSGEMYIDAISEELGVQVAEIMNELIDMQLGGYVTELPGKLYKLG